MKTGTFEYKLSDGRICKLEAKYECVMEHETIYSDGIPVTMSKATPTTAGRTNLTAYIDGKKIDSCWNSAAWGLKEVNGKRKISGLMVGFAKKEDAERYEAWIAEIIDGGKSDEVKAYEKAEKEKEIKAEVERAKSVITKAERQKDIPPQAEAKRRMKQYNDFMNEGGEGYVPYIYSLEEYEYAKQILEKYRNL